jgi:ABC-type transporter Mla maintaining outer membrane lipid asymmetry ATPase subunit MlaF
VTAAENTGNGNPVAVNGLRKSFGEQKVLNGIDLTVAEAKPAVWDAAAPEKASR